MAKRIRITVICLECQHKWRVSPDTTSALICPRCGGADFDVWDPAMDPRQRLDTPTT